MTPPPPAPGFIGYAPEMYAMVADRAVGDQDDDQLYYTLIYLDLEKRVSPDSRKEELHGVVSTPITLAACRRNWTSAWTTEPTSSKI